jgi:hypothetical protein
MFQSARQKFQVVAMTGVVAALAIGGVAVAQNESSGPSQGNQGQGQGPGRAGGPPPPLPLPMQGLTYAQLHVQKNGQEQTIRLDEGKVVSASESSVTISENDGSEVTVPVDDDTQVMGKPGTEMKVSELSAGQQVMVCGPEGGSAKTIAVLPKKGQGGPEQGGSQQGQSGPPQGGQNGQGHGQGGQLPPPPDGSGPGGSE